MNTKKKKTLATIAMILLFVGAYVVFIYYKIGKNEAVPTYLSIVFAAIPAIIINSIWNGIPLKNKK